VIIAEFLPAQPNRLWDFARQLGVKHVICKCAPELTGLNPPWDVDALRTIQRRFAARNKLFFVRFRDVRGTAARFEKTFHDDGPTDLPALLRLYHESGFTGPIRVDHVPTLAGESNAQPGYEALGRLFAIGYLKGALQALRIPYQ
jgi:D-mannonate dehydratase